MHKKERYADASGLTNSFWRGMKIWNLIIKLEIDRMESNIGDNRREGTMWLEVLRFEK